MRLHIVIAFTWHMLIQITNAAWDYWEQIWGKMLSNYTTPDINLSQELKELSNIQANKAASSFFSWVNTSAACKGHQSSTVTSCTEAPYPELPVQYWITWRWKIPPHIAKLPLREHSARLVGIIKAWVIHSQLSSRKHKLLDSGSWNLMLCRISPPSATPDPPTI